MPKSGIGASSVRLLSVGNICAVLLSGVSRISIPVTSVDVGISVALSEGAQACKDPKKLATRIIFEIRVYHLDIERA